MERPSYQYADKKNKPQGFDIDYMRALAKDLSCDIVFKHMHWPRQHKEMEAGRIDVLLGGVPVGGMLDVFLFSDIYRTDPIGFYVHKNDLSLANESSIKNLIDKGFKLGIVSYDHHHVDVRKLMETSNDKRNIFLINSTRGLLRNINKKMIRAVMLHSAEVDHLRSINDPLVKDLKLVPHLSFLKPASFVFGATSPLGKSFVGLMNGSIKRLKENGVTEKLLRDHVPSHFEILK